MKKSTAVVLVLSGSLLVGCDNGSYRPRSTDPVDANGNVVTNNTYRHGYGYWHAPYHSWFPYPYNYYSPTYGYYHGGQWASAPQKEPVVSSSSSSGRSGSSWFSGGSSSSGKSSSSSTSRGGFGSSGHSSS